MQLLLEILFHDIPYRKYELAAISRSGCGLKQKTTALAICRHPQRPDEYQNGELEVKR